MESNGFSRSLPPGAVIVCPKLPPICGDEEITVVVSEGASYHTDDNVWSHIISLKASEKRAISEACERLTEVW